MIKLDLLIIFFLFLTTIGHRPDNPISFPGAIDEFRIYDKELNQGEINEINNYVIIE